MIRRLTAFCLLASGLAIVAACSGNSSDPSASNEGQKAPRPGTSDATPTRPRIVALGDSLTAGFGLLESQAYPAVLQAKLDKEGYDFEVVNAGVSGDTSAGGLRRLDWSLEGDVRVLIVGLGANDGLRGLSIDQMKDNLGTIIRRAQERNIVVMLAGMEAPPNYGPEYTAAFRNAYRDLAREHRVLFIPFLLDRVAGVSDMNQRDGIHPNPQGTAIMAETVWRVLRPVLDQMSASS